MSELEEGKVIKLPEGVDFSLVIMSIDGETPIKSQEEEGYITLGEVCQAALLASTGDKPDQTQILKRFNLAQKVGKKNEEGEFLQVKLSSKEKTMILKQGEGLVKVGSWGTLLFARVYEALEGSTEE